ncbi:type II toxin-antitoxin system HicA family toxin [Bradyrhizobium sp.]|uniref:type II toxin-antitoxin system HicA family toxin n=1 Tax=Bradyrhizobium sp. TaxID=376 RepID=UPI003C6BAA9C
MDELMRNRREAIEGCLSTEVGARRHRNSAGISCMKSVSGRDLARIVERRGWTLLRVSGSHHICISVVTPEALFGYQFQYTATSR